MYIKNKWKRFFASLIPVLLYSLVNWLPIVSTQMKITSELVVVFILISLIIFLLCWRQLGKNNKKIEIDIDRFTKTIFEIGKNFKGEEKIFFLNWHDPRKNQKIITKEHVNSEWRDFEEVPCFFHPRPNQEIIDPIIEAVKEILGGIVNLYLEIAIEKNGVFEFETKDLSCKEIPKESILQEIINCTSCKQKDSPKIHRAIVEALVKICKKHGATKKGSKIIVWPIGKITVLDIKKPLFKFTYEDPGKDDYDLFLSRHKK